MEAIDTLLDVDPPENGAPRSYQTLGGLVLTTLGRVARTGDTFEYAGRQFDVLIGERFCDVVGAQVASRS